MGGLLVMNQKELDLVKILDKVMQGQLSQKRAAESIGISDRQLRRKLKQYNEAGAVGIVSKKRFSKGNHSIPDEVKKQAIELIFLHYGDFGPTLAHEKLLEKHGLKISVSTVRSLMIEYLLWIPQRAKAPIIHQSRERRPCLGQLIQFDGSIHHWFEERGSRCAALVFVDDATSRLMLLRFVPIENLWDYFAAMQEYLKKYGRPEAVYCDRHSALRNRKPSLLETRGMTQFQRAMTSLNIKLIHAHSPQAKGRVERANRTLQDRLVKELRLQGISTLEAANAFADEFTDDYNKRFAIVPKSSIDAHRSIEEGMDLDQIFSWHDERKVLKNLMIQYAGKHYLIVPEDRYRANLRGATIKVIENYEGEIRLFYGEKELKYRLYEELPYEESSHEMELRQSEAERWLNKKEDILQAAVIHGKIKKLLLDLP